MSSVIDFQRWWITSSEEEAEATAAKLQEYGAGDLVEIGHMLAHLRGIAASDDMAFEIGVLFYAYGKIWRIISAQEKGIKASDDTWLDLHIYSKMVLARRNGKWPKNEEKSP